MHKVETQRSGELFVKNVLILIFYVVIIKNYKVKKLFNKFPEISGIGINFQKFSMGNFRTYNPNLHRQFLWYVHFGRGQFSETY